MSGGWARTPAGSAWKRERGFGVGAWVRIGRASQVSGASVRALRYYEDEGLITPGRLANGYRDYCPSTVAAVVRVRSLLEAGLPVRLVRELLPHLIGGGRLLRRAVFGSL
ncbi:MerR family transcriptional regulator [Actinomadura sp. 1N219]|uniref:MerR family transcriptional regulator n=1 Tax=Actinomadura sp. 1N219 TaxID=3375152 RepID=UPI0037936F16